LTVCALVWRAGSDRLKRGLVTIHDASVASFRDWNKEVEKIESSQTLRFPHEYSLWINWLKSSFGKNSVCMAAI
jgi:hypothetical protein